MFHASTLVKPLNLSLTFLILFAHPFKTSFAQDLLVSEEQTPLPAVAAQAENVLPPSVDVPRVLTQDFMNPSPIFAADLPSNVISAPAEVLQTSATVELESVNRSGAFYSDSKGTMIYADGRLGFNLPDLAEGIYQITVYAFGFPRASVTPQFRMLADNKMISNPVEVTNQDWTYRPYTISNVELAGTGHDFRIELPGGFGEVNLYLDKVVFQKTGDLLPPAQRVVLEAEAMTVQGGFYQASNSMLLWSNGSLTSQRQVESGVYDIEVVAFGLEGDGDLPRMRLLASNRMAGDAVRVKNNNWNYQGYTFSGVELEGGSTDFALQFFNDSPARDLWVDKIILRKRGELAYKGNRVVSQAEALPVSGASFTTSTATAIWNDGVLRLPLNDIQSGKYTVEFDAFGVPFNGTLPRAQVFVDGTALGSPIEAANNDWNYQHYKTAEVSLQGGDHEILIKLAPGFSAGNFWLDRVLLRKTGEIPAAQGTQVFSLALDSTILNSALTYGAFYETVSGGLLGWATEISKKFLNAYRDQFDFLIFVPTLQAAQEISSWATHFTDSNAMGSFSTPIRETIDGIGVTLGADYSPYFGSSAAGEMDSFVYLDAGLSYVGDFRLSTSNLATNLNLLLWEHIAAHEIHHRFGSYLTRDTGNPFGILGRQLAHWGPFFDADFSPMDGNDWVDNGNGTFTVTHSYFDEIYFHRTTNVMPFNDFDLYSMGLLSAEEVKAGFVIDNPRLSSTGQRVRPYVEEGDDPRGGGAAIEVEQANGTWVIDYLRDGAVVTGTKRVVTLADILGVEGPRSPSALSSPRNFNAAFVVLTDSDDTSATIQAHTNKITLLQNSLTSYFSNITRGLASLTLPQSGVSYARAAAISGSAVSVPGSLAPAGAASITEHAGARLSAGPAAGGLNREYLVRDILNPSRSLKPARKSFKRKDLNRLYALHRQVGATA